MLVLLDPAYEPPNPVAAIRFPIESIRSVRLVAEPVGILRVVCSSEVVSTHHAPLVWWSDVRTRGTDLNSSIPTSAVQTTAPSAVVAMADVGNGFTGTGMGELFAFNLDRRVFNRIDAPSGTPIRGLEVVDW
jgi:hypothetical protein